MGMHDFDYEKEPTVSIVKTILTEAINLKASDIHFNINKDELVIRFRIDGELVLYTKAPIDVSRNITTRVKILANMNITDYTTPQNGNIIFELGGKNHNMRASTLPSLNGENIVVHLSDYKNSLEGLDKLGIDNENVTKIKDALEKKDGIIIVAGDTASGKSTLLYSMLKELDSLKLNIISIEDPIKMEMPGIVQIQLSPEKGITNKSIFKNIFLQDPNVLALNEIRNDATAKLAVRASTTGRLVLTTIYSKNVYTTINNLIDMDVENYLLSSTIGTVISQRLVKKLCPKCAKTEKVTNYQKDIIKKVLGKDVKELKVPVGCSDCINGYSGRVPIIEVVHLDDEIRKLILNNERENLYGAIYSKNENILTNGLSKVVDGITSFDEIIKAIDVDTDVDPTDDELKKLIYGQKNRPVISVDEPLKQENELEEKQEKEEKNKEKNISNSEINNDEIKTIIDEAEKENKDLENKKKTTRTEFDELTNLLLNSDASKPNKDAKNRLENLLKTLEENAKSDSSEQVPVLVSDDDEVTKKEDVKEEVKETNKNSKKDDKKEEVKEPPQKKERKHIELPDDLDLSDMSVDIDYDDISYDDSYINSF